MSQKDGNRMWTEKYRPKSYEKLEAPEYLKRFLAHAIENGHPHLLLYGPPGTGKTTFAEMLRPTIVLNASDERGIDVIRNKIKKAANTLKKEVILLDECENLSKDAQTCLRRIMEDYTNTTFIFCTNYYSRIIDPLKSRLLKLKFTGVSSGILDRIGEEESLLLDSPFYTMLFHKCKFDLRRCINILQGIKPIIKGSEGDNIITFSEREIDDFTGRIPKDIINRFHNINKMNYEEFVRFFVKDGFSALQLIQQLAEILLGNEKEKLHFSLALGECEGYSANGCSDEIVLRRICLAKLEIYSV